MFRSAKVAIAVLGVVSCSHKPSPPTEERWSNADVEVTTHYAFRPGASAIDVMNKQAPGSLDALSLDMDPAGVPVVVDVTVRALRAGAAVGTHFSSVFDSPQGPVTRDWDSASSNASGHSRALLVAPAGVTAAHTRLRP